MGVSSSMSKSGIMPALTTLWISSLESEEVTCIDDAALAASWIEEIVARIDSWDPYCEDQGMGADFAGYDTKRACPGPGSQALRVDSALTSDLSRQCFHDFSTPLFCTDN